MRLSKDTLSTWDNAKGPLQADLTKIQQGFDDLQATILAQQAQIAALQAKTAFSVPVIQPNSTVKTFTKLDPTKPAIPFGGTSPSTPQIFGPAYQLDVANVTLTNLVTTPLLLVPGVAGKVIIPWIVGMEATQGAGTGWTNGNTNFRLIIDVVANILLQMPTMAIAAAGPNTRFTITGGVTWSTIAPVGAAEHFSGKALKLSSGANITAGTSVVTCNLSLIYFLASLTLFS